MSLVRDNVGIISMKLKIVLKKGPDDYVTACCPSLKGCISKAKTAEKAINDIKDALKPYLEIEAEEEINKHL